MRAIVVACLLTACSFPREPLAVLDSGSISMPDALDGAPPCKTYSSIFDTCAVGALLTMKPLTLTGGAWTYNTDTNTLTSPTGITSQPPHIVVAAATTPIDMLFVASLRIEADSSLRAVGTTNDRPLGVAATGTIEIDGVIDVSDNGAGARDDADCGAQLGKRGNNNANGAGGSGGGAFHGDGGDGSDGNLDGANPTKGGAGGAALATRPTSPLGGCDGGDGGDGNANGGLAGDGGGAMYLVSATSIHLGAAGVLDAGGGGGSPGGDNDDGGGGGGSGGMILLESTSVVLEGIVVANGGGGGEGNTNGRAGESGRRSALRARGGSGGDAAGGNGADGGAGANAAGNTTTDVQNGGGGGGGGGVGYIAIACPTPSVTGSVISPPYQGWP